MSDFKGRRATPTHHCVANVAKNKFLYMTTNLYTDVSGSPALSDLSMSRVSK